jgi:hypothetical protein
VRLQQQQVGKAKEASWQQQAKGQLQGVGREWAQSLKQRQQWQMKVSLWM